MKSTIELLLKAFPGKPKLEAAYEIILESQSKEHQEYIKRRENRGPTGSYGNVVGEKRKRVENQSIGDPPPRRSNQLRMHYE